MLRGSMFSGVVFGGPLGCGLRCHWLCGEVLGRVGGWRAYPPKWILSKKFRAIRKLQVQLE